MALPGAGAGKAPVAEVELPVAYARGGGDAGVEGPSGAARRTVVWKTPLATVDLVHNLPVLADTVRWWGCLAAALVWWSSSVALV